jgi:hypothetical protein
MRAGGPRTQALLAILPTRGKVHFSRAIAFCEPGILPWVLGPPARMSSRFSAPFHLKAPLRQGMRAGGPRTQALLTILLD